MAKSVEYNGIITRLSDEAAALLVKRGGRYVPKAAYRKYRQQEREEFAVQALRDAIRHRRKA